MVAIGAGIPCSRVDETLDLVGLSDVARRRVGKFSLGMRQRLQLATALLGDPEILILDEPSNGLDPQGIQWLRTFIRHQASIGHAVLVSSHLLSEMEETVDDVVIVSHGRLVLQTTLAELATQAGTAHRTAHPHARAAPGSSPCCRPSRWPTARRRPTPWSSTVPPRSGSARSPPSTRSSSTSCATNGAASRTSSCSLTHGFDAADPAPAGGRPVGPAGRHRCPGSP